VLSLRYDLNPFIEHRPLWDGQHIKYMFYIMFDSNDSSPQLHTVFWRAILRFGFRHQTSGHVQIGAVHWRFTYAGKKKSIARRTTMKNKQYKHVISYNLYVDVQQTSQNLKSKSYLKY
jgi:hypothetical protein